MEDWVRSHARAASEKFGIPYSIRQTRDGEGNWLVVTDNGYASFEEAKEAIEKMRDYLRYLLGGGRFDLRIRPNGAEDFMTFEEAYALLYRDFVSLIQSPSAGATLLAQMRMHAGSDL